MSRSGAAISAIAALCLSAGSAAAVSFQATVIDANGPSRVWGKGVGDLNGDGYADLVVGSYDGGLYSYQNPGWTKRTISASAHIEEDMAVVDYDKDGRTDVVAITKGGVTFFRHTATGWTANLLVRGVDLHDIVVSDLDGDGVRDLAGRGQGAAGNRIYLWRRAGPGQMLRTQIDLPIGGEGFDQRDLDRDGRNDLVIGRYWFRNTSAPGRLSFTRYLYNAAAPVNAYVALGDINMDGRVDIVTSPAEPNNGRYRVSWFQAPANPTGGWAEHVIQDNVETVTHFVGVADVDRDGDLDIASALTHLADNPSIKLYLNRDHRGAFNAPQIIAHTSSHSMKFVRVGNDAGPSLFGADYGNLGRTPIRLFRWRAN